MELTALEVCNKLIEEIKWQVDEIKNAWANGKYTGAEAYETTQLNAQAIGQIQTLENILEYIELLKKGEVNE